MKIAVVSDAIYPYNKGGKEKKIYEITTHLAHHGYDVHIYTMKWWKENTNLKRENGVYLHAISPLFPLYAKKRRSFSQAILFSLYCFSLLKENFDVIDVDHMPHLVIFSLKIVCLIKKKKLFVSWNEVWGKSYWKKYIGSLGLPAYYIEKVSVTLPNRIISISSLTTKKLQNELKRTHELHTIPLGINYQEIETVKPSQQSSDVIFAGRLLENKNVDVLVQAMMYVKRIYPRIHCVIIGEGPERETLEKLIRTYKLKKNITMIGFLQKQQDLYALFKSSKIFAFPSTREGFGLTVLEANACGLPAIVVDHEDNASKDLIRKHTGVVIPLSASGFASAIVHLLTVKVNKVAISNVAKQYDWERIALQTAKVYQQ